MPTCFDPDVWIRRLKGGYNYIRKNTNDVFIVSANPTSIFKNLKETYTIKTFGPSKVHLGSDYSQVKKGATTQLVMGSSTYTEEALRKICALLKVVTLRKEKLTSSPGDHPELYSSTPMSEEQQHLYQQLVGIEEWMVQIGISIPKPWGPRCQLIWTRGICENHEVYISPNSDENCSRK